MFIWRKNNSLFVDVGKRLWVGTADAGVFVINFQKNSIEQISKNEGLPSNYISSIVEANEYVWVSSPKGISRIDKKRNIYTLRHATGCKKYIRLVLFKSSTTLSETS